MSWEPTVAIGRTSAWPGTVRVVRNTTEEYRVYVLEERQECHMESVRDYQVSKCATSWGCVCSECGGFHEFTDGKGWRFCPSCGVRVVSE